MLLIASALFTGAAASASVRMPAIFGSHMVLQEDATLPVWGWANAGEKVTVQFRDQKQSTVAAADGAWRVELKPVTPDEQPGTLTVAGDKDSLTFTDVLVGDVWVASGQSNMEFGIQTDSRGADAIATATDSAIRFFFVPWATALSPQPDIRPGNPPSPLNGKWLVCSPEIMKTNWGWHGCTAVGYYFIRDIRALTHHPVALIATYKGGTPAQAWTSVGGLEQEPALAHYVTNHQALVDNLDKAKAAYQKAQADFQLRLKEWRAKVQEATNAGKALPAGTEPRAPLGPDGGPGAPANLFNAMVSPLVPYAIKGVIWYQGEGNANNFDEAAEYRTLFPAMIRDWRQQWHQGDFPFLFVQLPNMNHRVAVPSEGRWPWVRDAQLRTLELPKTGMAVTIDVGDADNLHPTDKLYVGKRLALAARHVAYGQDLVYSGPLYDSMKVEGGKIRISFTQLGKGLTIGVPPANTNGFVASPASELKGFALAGSDQKFVWAQAVINGDTVVVSSDKVADPVAVRYDWQQNPPGNLYNREGLPASPFRTDSWPPVP